MLYNEPSPLETRVISKRFGIPNSASLDTYLATGGFKAFLKAREMTPEQIVDEVKASALRGRGGADFPPDSSGASFRAPRPSPNTSWSTPMRASPAPARIAC